MCEAHQLLLEERRAGAEPAGVAEVVAEATRAFAATSAGCEAARELLERFEAGLTRFEQGDV